MDGRNSVIDFLGGLIFLAIPLFVLSKFLLVGPSDAMNWSLDRRERQALWFRRNSWIIRAGSAAVISFGVFSLLHVLLLGVYDDGNEPLFISVGLLSLAVGGTVFRYAAEIANWQCDWALYHLDVIRRNMRSTVFVQIVVSALSAVIGVLMITDVLSRH